MLAKPAVPATALILSVMLSFVSVVGVAAQGLTARVAPEGAALRFGASVGLQNANLFGGAGAIGFGRYVVLRASYKTASSVRTDLARSGYGDATSENSLDASLWGTSVQLRLGDGRVAPVLLGGGGILALRPAGRDEAKRITATYGAGVDARLTPWLDAQLFLQPVRFRFDRAAVANDAGGVPPVDPNASDLQNSLALTASIGARIGGSRSSAHADALDSDMSDALQGGDGLMVPFEVVAGVLSFSDALAIGSQSTAGFRAGLDFGPYFGVRGGYARGFSSNSFVGMSTWSGEAQFNVGRVTGLSPHLLLGYGGLSFWGSFLDENGFVPADANALILGAGLGLPISDRSRFIMSVRDYVTTAGVVAGVSTTSDLRHNFGVTAGLSFALRGRRQTLRQPDATFRAPFPTSGPPIPADSAPSPAVPDLTAVAPSPDSAVALVSGAEASELPMAGVAAPTSYQSERVLSIPIPTQGELYIRYGPAPTREILGATPSPDLSQVPGGASPIGATSTNQDSVMARLVRTEVALALANLQPVPGGAITAGDLALLEARIADRLARMDTVSGQPLTRADLDDVESRLVEQFAAILQDRSRSEPAAAARSPEIDALTAQVNQLTALVRERNETAAQPVMVSIASGGSATAVPGGSGAPFIRGARGLLGSASVRNGGAGFGARADVMMGELLSGWLQPWLGVQFGRAGVDGSLAGAPFAGSVTSIGGGVGVAANLPRVRSLAPELSVGVIGVGGGVSGGTQPEADIMETIYGGFVMGPRVALDIVWQRQEASRVSLDGGIARTWAGSRGGWSVQFGLRWLRAFTRRPVLFVRSDAPSEMVASPVTPPSAPAVVPQAASDTSGSGGAAAASPDSVTLARIAQLERALEEERQARRRIEEATESRAAATTAAAARADSVSRSEVETARRREVEAAAALASRRETLRADLEALLGVVEDVQSVRQTERGLEVVIGGGAFPTGSATLDGAARARVARVAAVLSRATGYSFLVDGHTDSTGSDATNRVVSQQRAEAVRAVLIAAGIPPQAVEVLASGPARPVAPNDTRDGRAQNRRVEIVILDF
jgi:outer membrane protein OmpA-like peptidoglycan-associated protein